MSECDHWKTWTMEQWQNAVYCEDCGLPMLEVEDSQNRGHYLCPYCTWTSDEIDILKAENGRLLERVDVLDQTLDFHQQVFGFHPRATKLMGKRKPFLVVACDEPYFRQVYDLIRDHEMQKGTWTHEDQWHYDDAFSSKGR
jgi:hypothetical protein